MISAANEQQTAAARIPPGWYCDPWQIAPHRWWDGRSWTPVLRGPYGEAWPTRWAPASRPAPPQPKGPGIQGGGVAALGGVVGVVLSTIVALLLSLFGHMGLEDPWLILGSQLGLWTGFIGAVVVASKRNGTGSLAADYGLAWPRAADVGLGVLGGLAGRLIPTALALLIALEGGISRSASQQVPTILGTQPHGRMGWAVVVVLAVVGAPVVEELLFRGLVQGAFSRRTGAVPAIYITAFIFAIAHVFNEGLGAPLVIFPAGLVLGYLRYRTGRLAAGMIAHATFNGTLFLLLLIPAFR